MKTKTASNLNSICSPCGVSANVLTCLKKYGRPPKKLCFTVSTFHMGICDVCKDLKPVSEHRDFFHPDVSLIAKYVKTFAKKPRKAKA